MIKNLKFIKKSMLVAVMAAALTFSGCGNNTDNNVSDKKQTQQTQSKNESTSKDDSNKENNTTAPTHEEESVELLSGKHYVTIDVADYGKISLELDADTAPITVTNFIDLASSGFYDGLTFHRIMSGFMIQGGDPLGNGRGGSEKEIKGECTNNGVENNISHKRGVISMARNPVSYDSASSQFFIVHEDSTFLDGEYAAFGIVTEGMDVVDAICKDAKPLDDNGTIDAESQPVISEVTVVEK